MWEYLRLSLFCAAFVQRSCAFDDYGVRQLTFHSLPSVYRSESIQGKPWLEGERGPFVLGYGVSELGVDFSTPQIENASPMFPPFSRPFTFLVSCLQRLIQRWSIIKWQRRREKSSTCNGCHDEDMGRRRGDYVEAVGGWHFKYGGACGNAEIGGNAITQIMKLSIYSK